MMTLLDKTLVILGFQRQGQALARFALEQGANVIVSDLSSAEQLGDLMTAFAHSKLEFVLGSHPLTLLENADALAVSGGVPLTIPIVQAALAQGVPLTNDSQQFLERTAARVIGITGSAGKSTTTTLVGEMCRATGQPTHVGGNIGDPLIGRLNHIAPTDFVVQELSSFQLEIATTSPQIAAILNITPNHLDRHKTMTAYANAKAEILRHQSDDSIAVLPAIELSDLEPLIHGRLRHFSITDPVDDGAFLDDQTFILRDGQTERTIASISDVQLRGRHNLANICAAITLADSAGVPADAMRHAIETFKGIPHRLEPVATHAGVTYINDSIATAPERAMAAIHAFTEPLVLLAGGRDKELDWDDWSTLVQARCKAVVLFGECASMVRATLESHGQNAVVEQVSTLPEAIAAAQQLAKSGDIVLLSPGGTSYDAYKDFAERGDHFRRFVSKLEVAV